MELGKPDESRREKFENYYLTVPDKMSLIYLKKYKVNVHPRVILRVALDSFFKDDWHGRIASPAYKNLSYLNLKQVVYAFKNLMEPKLLAKGIEYSNSKRFSNLITPNLIEALNDIKK